MTEQTAKSPIDGKVVLVTGGTGSFGKKFAEHALTRCDPKRVIIFSRDELKQHEMRLERTDRRLSFFVGDVRDRDRLYRAFKADVDLVIHAAALKQVPSCEYNPFEAIKTNILGAQNIIDAAIDCGVSQVLNLSTDKAVSPVNLYGATKLCAEKLFVQGNSYAGSRPTRFSCVRYGNVIGSRGSVVPVFRAQRASGRLSVTDERMTRFWLTIEHGVEFVIRCVGLMQGGEIFVPRVPSMSLMALAEAVAPGCEVDHTGIRPGEKLHETLVSIDEARHAARVGDMYVIYPEFQWWGAHERPEGETLADGFSYTSDGNDQHIGVEDLRRLIDEE